MDHAMRRPRQELSKEECRAVLRRGTSGVLALSAPDEYPYAVPLSYVYDGEDRIYFHCAQVGHKIDLIVQNDRCSFCVIDQDQVIPEKFTTYYRSVIAFGRICVIAGTEQKRAPLEMLAGKYSPGLVEETRKKIEASLDQVRLLELHIEKLSGKAAKDLMAR